MFQNYFKTAIRSLLRNRLFSGINVAGLSIGLACCMLIILYTKDEVSFDRFHANNDRLYRITTLFEVLNTAEVQRGGFTSITAAETFGREVPEIEAIVRLQGTDQLMKKGNEVISEPTGLYADENFFSVLSFTLLAGNPQTALREPNSIVITEELAQKYFGTANAVGKELSVNQEGKFQRFTVTGVAEAPPQNSTIQFNYLLPFQLYRKSKTLGEGDWTNNYLNALVLLRPGADPVKAAAKCTRIFQYHGGKRLTAMAQERGMKIRYAYYLQPLTDMHLSPGFGSGNGLGNVRDPFYTYILSGIAGFILLIACFNFINLTVSQSMSRAKEVGIRKVIGGQREQLVRQFLGESLLLCLAAFALALLLADIVLPEFNLLADKKLSLSYLFDFWLVTGYLGLLVMTALAAGFYPAWVLSGFNPVNALYGKQRLTGKHLFAKSLVITQFALATLLIIGTLTIYSQTQYMLSMDLGYNDENLIMVQLPREGNKQLEVFKNELNKHPDVIQVAGRSGGVSVSFFKAGEKDVETYMSKIDENYFAAFGIPLEAGRTFSRAFPGDSTRSVLVNEAFVKEAGWKNPVGQHLTFPGDPGRKLTVIGMVKNYHFEPLHQKIKPHLYHQFPQDSYRELWVKVKPGRTTATLALLEKTYYRAEPLFPFWYQFQDEVNAHAYQTENQWKQMLGYAAGLAIFISCIGLFGLVTLAIGQRTKEIGIRKVLGAPVGIIVALLSIDFVKLIIISFIVAIPLGYYAASRWLQNFPYRIQMHWWLFALVSMSILGLALLTIGFQSVKAALANPVKSLRSE